MTSDVGAAAEPMPGGMVRRARHGARVTIGMPVYNGAATIAAAIESLRAQSYADFRLIISDNGSTDATGAICAALAEQDARITYVRQPTNLGPNLNFRHVLFAAETPYFMWAAGDDLWAPDFVATLMRALDDNPAAVCCQSRVLFTKAGQPSHLATGTYALAGPERQNLARFLMNPADNSRYYGLFRTAALKGAFPDRSFFALDWAVAAATLRDGIHLEAEPVLMIRDSSDAASYENMVAREHRRLLWRLFPVLYMSRWLVFSRRIPLSAGIVRALVRLNIYMTLRFGLYRAGSAANRFLAAESGLHQAVGAITGPGLGRRLRALAGRAVRPLRRAARAVWRRLPLTSAQREAVRRNMVRVLGDTALRLAGTPHFTVARRDAAEPPPVDPARRGAPENIWRLAPATGAAPALSVILVVRGGLAETLRGIDALNGGDIAAEIIVVDNGSTDATALALAGVAGIRYLRCPQCVPFGEAVLLGAGSATAPELVAMEQGAVPAATFLSGIAAGLRHHPAVAAQARDETGLVRAAGLPLADAEGVEHGLPPNHPLCMTHHVVDTAEGALAWRAVLRPLLEQARGAPDFAAFARAFIGHAARTGAETVCWPGAPVYLLGAPVREAAPVASAVDQAAATAAPAWPRGPVALFVDAETPMPDQNAGSIETLNFIEQLQAFGFHVLFVPESNFAYRGKYTDQLVERGVTALYGGHFTSMEQVLERFGPELSLVVLCRASIAERHIPLVRRLAPRAPIIFNTIDLHFLREQRAAELSGDPAALAAAAASRDAELATMRAADATIVLSTHEQALLAQIAPEVRVHVLPMARRLPERLDGPGFAERRDLMFVGTYQHPPNEDAVVFFVNEVWPLVRPHLPEARFLIVGSSVTPAVAGLAGNGVEVLGHVEDLDALLGRCRLSVAPVRFGAGLKGKVISSIQAGVPVVATTIAVEGFGLVDGAEALIADQPAEFAAAVVRLYQDPELWERLSTAGFALLRREFRMEGNAARLARLLGDVGVTTFGMELQALQAELAASGPRYAPSAFWKFLADANLPLVLEKQLPNFKRTINNNYFQFLPGDMTDPQFRRLLAFWTGTPGMAPIEAACSADILARDVQVTSAFDYNPFANPDYARFYGFFVGMLWHFACCNDPEGLHAELEEPEVGGPIPVQAGGRRISQDLANSLHEWSRARQLMAHAPLPERPLVLEIGAGYGRLAHVFLKAGRCRYAIVDIAPALVVAKWYLSAVHPGLRVFGWRHFDRFDEVAEEIAAADICFFSANQIALLPHNFAEIGIAISCLHEMRRDQIAFYLDALSDKVRNVVYMKNWTRWENPRDGFVVDRDTFRLDASWRCVLDEAHPVNGEMWETGYLRG